jgi:hypothetical protein
MSWLLPQFEGHLTLDPLPDDFAARIQRRVESGLLAPGRRDRADYEITVDRSGVNRIRYQVSFWGWTRIAVAHGLLLGAVLAAAFALYPPVRRDIALYPHGLLILFGMAAFWCLIWPWLLGALHKPHAERALRRILGEALSGAPAGGTGDGYQADARRAS